MPQWPIDLLLQSSQVVKLQSMELALPTLSLPLLDLHGMKGMNE
jgi:hypothetical protein